MPEDDTSSNSTTDKTASTTFPSPTFTKARVDAQGRQLPQCIAHRGYRAVYPENTIAAFQGALEAGASAIETDIHLTEDDVVVLSHDPTLKRCFGRTEKIVDCTWDEISHLKTTKTPHSPMPRLVDLLDFLSAPEREQVWCLLDIKTDNNADEVMRLIASTLSSHKSTSETPWTKRVVLGIWAAKYMPLCIKYLPGFPVMHIGFSVPYARHFLNIDGVGFNMLFPMLVAPGGTAFLRDAKQRYHRQVLAWTVNKADGMKWCITHGLDGVITDDPKLFNRVRELPPAALEAGFLPLSIVGLLDVLRLWITVFVLGFVFRKKFRPVASRALLEQSTDT